MVLAMYSRTDLKKAMNRIFLDNDFKQVYLKNDSYIWQCEKEIRQIVEIF